MAILGVVDGTWADAQDNAWGDYQETLANIEDDRVHDSAIATNTYETAANPIAADAGKEENEHDKTLADEVSTDLDTETQAEASALETYAASVAAARKKYAVALNKATAEHDTEVVAKNKEYRDARSDVYEKKTIDDAKAAKAEQDTHTYWRLAEYFDVPPLQGYAPVPLEQEARLNPSNATRTAANDARANYLATYNNGARWAAVDAYETAFRDTNYAAQVNGLADNYVTWVGNLSAAHVKLAQDAKTAADTLADDLKKAADTLSDSDADAAKDFLKGLADAEKTFTTSEAQTAENLGNDLAAPSDTYSSALTTANNTVRKDETAARGDYVVGEHQQHVDKLAVTTAPTGPAVAADQYQRDVAAADLANAKTERTARNTYETVVTNASPAPSPPLAAPASSPGLLQTNQLAAADKTFSDSLADAEATLEKSTSTAASLAAKTGVIAETKLDLTTAQAQAAYDSAMAAAKRTQWKDLAASWVTWDQSERVALRMSGDVTSSVCYCCDVRHVVGIVFWRIVPWFVLRRLFQRQPLDRLHLGNKFPLLFFQSMNDARGNFNRPLQLHRPLLPANVPAWRLLCVVRLLLSGIRQLYRRRCVAHATRRRLGSLGWISVIGEGGRVVKTARRSVSKLVVGFAAFLCFLAAEVRAATIELLSGAKVEGQVLRKDADNLFVEVKIGEKTSERSYPLKSIHAVTINGTRRVLNEKSADAGGATTTKTNDPPASGGKKSRAELDLLIDAEGKQPPTWFEATALDYPQFLDLTWPEKPERG